MAMEKYLEIRELLTAISKDLVELLKVPAEQAWHAANMVVRLQGIQTILEITIWLGSITLLIFIIHKYLYKGWYIATRQENQTSRRVTATEEVLLCVACIISIIVTVALPVFLYGFSSKLSQAIIQISYPEAVIIHKIMNKLLQ